MSERDPITKQRSEWYDVTDHAVFRPVLDGLQDSGSVEITIAIRRVHDGLLEAFRSTDNGKLHLSICWKPQSEMQARRGKVRYPTWDEIADARDVLLPEDKEFVMFLPKAEEYVAVHATTFHLHEHP